MSSSTVGVGADDLVTGEAVALDLPHAGLGLRICSGLIDVVVGLVALYALQWVAYTLAGSGDDALIAAAITLAMVGALVAIPTTFETLTRGKTLGHLALGLRTVRDDAGPIHFRQALTRAMVGVVEIYGCLGMPALLCAVFNQRGKRFGDLLAGTYVVRDRQRVSPPARADAATPRDVGCRGRHRPLPDSRRPRSASSSPAPGRSPRTCARSSPTGCWPRRAPTWPLPRRRATTRSGCSWPCSRSAGPGTRRGSPASSSCASAWSPDPLGPAGQPSRSA